MEHVLVAILVILDLILVGQPITLLDAIYPTIAIAVFGIFSLIFYFAGGVSHYGTHYIYPILNWEHPLKTSIVCLIVVVAAPVLHSIIFGIFRLRNYIYFKLFVKETVDLECGSSATIAERV